MYLQQFSLQIFEFFCCQVPLNSLSHAPLYQLWTYFETQPEAYSNIRYWRGRRRPKFLTVSRHAHYFNRILPFWANYDMNLERTWTSEELTRNAKQDNLIMCSWMHLSIANFSPVLFDSWLFYNEDRRLRSPGGGRCGRTHWYVAHFYLILKSNIMQVIMLEFHWFQKCDHNST